MILMHNQKMSAEMATKQGRGARTAEARSGPLSDLDTRPIFLVACDHRVLDVSSEMLRRDYREALDSGSSVKRFLPDDEATIKTMQ